MSSFTAPPFRYLCSVETCGLLLGALSSGVVFNGVLQFLLLAWVLWLLMSGVLLIFGELFFGLVFGRAFGWDINTGPALHRRCLHSFVDFLNLYFI